MAITGGPTTSNSIHNTLRTGGVSESKTPNPESTQVSLLETQAVVFDSGDLHKDRGTIDVRLGDLGNPPTGKGSLKKLGERIRNFFASVKTGIANGFSRIGESISARRELATQSRFIRDNIVATNKDVQVIDKKLLPEALCRALRTGDIDLIAGVITKGGNAIEGKTLRDSENNLITDNKIKVEKELAGFTGSIDYMLGNADIDKLKDMQAGLRQRLASNETALAVLDRFIEHYDFDALANSSFEAEVDKFRAIDLAGSASERNVISRRLVSEAFRGNSFFSYAMQSSSSLDSQELGKNLEKTIRNETRNDKGLYSVSSVDLTPASISQENAAPFMKGVNKLVEALTNPVQVRENFGKQTIDTLREHCQKIADAPGISSDTKNKMIDKLFVDQVFLRGGISAMITHGTKNKASSELMSSLAKVAQLLFNGAEPKKHPPNEHIKSSFEQAMVNTRQAIDKLKEVLEIPSVAPSVTDWVEK